MGISPFACPSGTSNITEDQQEKLAPLINFRQFFKLAAKDMYINFRSNCKLKFISCIEWTDLIYFFFQIAFDPNVVEVAKEDAQDFLGALDNALKKATPTFFRAPSTTT